VFKLYSLLANPREIKLLKTKYLSGGMGYGAAKETLHNLILKKFKSERLKYDYYNSNPEEVNIALEKGALKARKIANEVLIRVRKKTGY
jgi:tryptophanyl-tRNA synthetase